VNPHPCLGESGASSVKGGSSGAQRCLDALYETGRRPALRRGTWMTSARRRDFGRILLLSGVSPWMGCPRWGPRDRPALLSTTNFVWFLSDMPVLIVILGALRSAGRANGWSRSMVRRDDARGGNCISVRMPISRIVAAELTSMISMTVHKSDRSSKSSSPVARSLVTAHTIGTMSTAKSRAPSGCRGHCAAAIAAVRVQRRDHANAARSAFQLIAERGRMLAEISGYTGVRRQSSDGHAAAVSVDRLLLPRPGSRPSSCTRTAIGLGFGAPGEEQHGATKLAFSSGVEKIIDRTPK